MALDRRIPRPAIIVTPHLAHCHRQRNARVPLERPPSTTRTSLSCSPTSARSPSPGSADASTTRSPTPDDRPRELPAMTGGAIVNHVYDLAVDFMDMSDDRRLWTRSVDAITDVELTPGRHVIVGDDDADPKVARSISVDADGNIELRYSKAASSRTTTSSPRPDARPPVSMICHGPAGGEFGFGSVLAHRPWPRTASCPRTHLTSRLTNTPIWDPIGWPSWTRRHANSLLSGTGGYPTDTCWTGFEGLITRPSMVSARRQSGGVALLMDC